MIAAVFITAVLASPAPLTDASRHPRPALVETKKTRHAPEVAQAAATADSNSLDHSPDVIEPSMSLQVAPTAVPEVKSGLVLADRLAYFLYPGLGV